MNSIPQTAAALPAVTTVTDASASPLTAVNPPVRAPRGCTPAYGYTRSLPWCRVTDHAERDHPEDRSHTGDCLTVDLTQGVGEVDADGRFWRAQAAMYLIQHDRHDEPVIELGRNDARGVVLTLDEAQEIANNLLGLVAAARNAQDRA